MDEEVLNGLDLFSGIGGLALAVKEWVRPVSYCESDPYCQGVLLSRMHGGDIPEAPIWDDVRTFPTAPFRNIDIIYGGFPCQDISVAGNGAGLAGERSGLVTEIFRLTKELCPSFVFLENVPAIRTRGAGLVVEALAGLGYDCRWGVLSAFDVGAPHKRARWFLLAHSMRERQQEPQKRDGEESEGSRSFGSHANGLRDPVPDSQRIKLRDEQGRSSGAGGAVSALAEHASWWESEPGVGRVAHGVSKRVDRLRGLGNAVVPAQAREAFRHLAGIKEMM